MDAGNTFKTSFPFGEPVKENPRVYSFFVKDISVGVGLVRVATPSAIESTKSSLFRLPVPEPVLYEFSLKVTLIDLLSAAKTVFVIAGPLLSFRFFIAFFCSTSAAFPPPSNIESFTGLTFKTSAPSAVPVNVNPSV